MNINEFRQMLQLVLDDEATEKQIKAFHEQISKNAEYRKIYEVEQTTHLFIKQKISRTNTPSNLIDDIRSSISKL